MYPNQQMGGQYGQPVQNAYVRPPRPPKDPAKTEAVWKKVGLISGIAAIACVLAVVALLVIFVILPKGEYKGAAAEGYHAVAGSSQPASTELPTEEQTETEE